MNFLLQVPEVNMWSSAPGPSAIYKAIVVILIGFAIVFALLKAPTQARRPIVTICTFLAGLFFVLSLVWPEAINFDPTKEAPRSFFESGSAFLKDAGGVVVNFTQILSGFLLGLGIFSLLKIHLERIAKGHKESPFSIILLVSFFAMLITGAISENLQRHHSAEINPSALPTVVQISDLLFNGLLQQMDAVMFSLIAFFIISAAYRAFRVRSIEATILLATAVIMMLSLMGVVVNYWDNTVIGETKGFASNFKLDTIANWLKSNVQTPALNGLTFGVSLGAFAMGLRIWLSLEKLGGK